MSEDVFQPQRFTCAGSRRRNSAGEAVCNYSSDVLWSGNCPNCGRPYNVIKRSTNFDKPVLSLAELADAPVIEHYPTGVDAFDQVLAGGLVKGLVILLGGKRGSGKSTLLLQVASGFARKTRQVLFASGEQTGLEIGQYARRIHCANENIAVLGLDAGGIYAEKIRERAQAIHAKLIIIDSAQSTIYNDVEASAGSPSQVDALANDMTEFSKDSGIPFIIVNHMTQAGLFAGSTKLQHLVDTILYFDNLEEKDEFKEVIPATKGLRKLIIDGKSRHGASHLTAMLELTDDGVKVPSTKKLAKWKKSMLYYGTDDTD